MIQYILQYFIIISFCLTLFFGCNNDTATIDRDEEDPNEHYQSYYTPDLSILSAFESGNNHMPFGSGDIVSSFQGLNLSNVSVANFNMPSNLSILNFQDFQTFINFYKAWIVENFLPYNPYRFIHSFGVSNITNNPTSRVGWTYVYNKQGLTISFPAHPNHFYKIPALTFVMCQGLRDVLTGNTETVINKYINRITVHEIAHARGLNARVNWPEHTTHCNENNQIDGYCAMYQTSEFSNNYSTNSNFIYPAYLCKYHKDIFRNELSNKITQDIIMPDPPQPCQN